MEADRNGDGKLDFDEFAMMVSNTVSTSLLFFIPRLVDEHILMKCHLQDIVKQMTLEDLF
jgi:hypothetical protein